LAVAENRSTKRNWWRFIRRCDL